MTINIQYMCQFCRHVGDDTAHVCPARAPEQQRAFWAVVPHGGQFYRLREWAAYHTDATRWPDLENPAPAPAPMPR